ncbi:HAD-IIIC family phosphatase [Paramaledivibacter caminithermalis]|jgi:FkbH-like protein|uniref:HAD-superfamily phosphatase, subfamily IIIC/FkbH-like domain-containing protein n=1 Tax=Paramaledivibacter caminithermalis (strain DSM 15212 / CIP 107654 / DViRD3) TaxID=1121301 RepID=A0A1M6L7C4_PARC5|nr:HAD-IIIC family phosphatase [Paramaledivibacter caminithermalis]SHJ67044.1 HAD-superfamily phosphatase, subfamily IIIC/FkbH-like domain-containing protein [Paramaledivibacter caminithermalis DSM 15212]
MKISLLSNINIDLLAKKLRRDYEVYKPEGYGVWVQEMLNKNSGLNNYNPDIVFILLDGDELINKDLDIVYIRKEIDTNIGYIENYIKNNIKTHVFVNNLDLSINKVQSIKDIRVERIIQSYWYEKLWDLNNKYGNFYIFDIKTLIESIGRNEFYSKKLWYLGGIKFSSKGDKLIKKEIDRCVGAFKGQRKKCLILDLDNTLWGGIIGEDGMDRIILSEHKEGARYKDFQKRLKEIKNTGVILAVVSKNNYDDALEVFKNHKHMILNEEDFVLMKINWKSKAENIREIAEELNIGLDSLVFIDDNPVERESIKSQIPEVVVPEFPDDTAELEKFIIDIYNDYFLSIKATEEDKKKTNMYKQNFNREKEMKSTASFEEFLKNLNTKIKIWKAKEDDIERAAQLTQKTNQFNLTTKRYLESDIDRFISSDKYDVYIASIEDKFGDNGKVSLIIIEKNDDKTVKIDTFLMSCRVMGRFIEEQIIDFIEDKYKRKGYEKIISYYYPTRKNKPVETLFEDLGYILVDKDKYGNKSYELLLDKINNERKKYGELMEL